MSKKLCITTVCSNDYFQFYIPLFSYSLHRAYPKYDCKIFLKGKLDKRVKAALALFDAPNHEIIENQFLDYPDRPSLCNTVRHLLPEFKKYDYLYITDIDFVYFRQEPSLLYYYEKRLIEGGEPYAAFRSPKQKPVQPHITVRGWTGSFTRLASGTVLLKLPEWYEKTRKQREFYKRIVKTCSSDTFDLYTAASYREYDEVMFYRICKESGMKTPAKVHTFLDGNKMNWQYRDLHLGDFKFAKRWKKMHRMKWRFTSGNVKAFKKLEKDEVWQKICDIVCKAEPVVDKIIHNVRKHVKKRK